MRLPPTPSRVCFINRPFVSLKKILFFSHNKLLIVDIYESVRHAGRVLLAKYTPLPGESLRLCPPIRPYIRREEREFSLTHFSGK